MKTIASFLAALAVLLWSPLAMAAPALLGMNSLVTQGATVTLCTPYPSGVAAGVYAVYYVGGQTNGWGAPTAPSGFTQATVSSGGLTGAAIYYRKLTGSESGSVCLGASFSSGVNNSMTSSLSLWSGLPSSGTPYESANAAANCCNNVSAASSSIVTTGTNEVAVVFWSVINWGSTADRGSSPGVGWTNGGGDTWATVAGCSGGGCGAKAPLDYKSAPTAGTVAAETRTANSSSNTIFAVASLALLAGSPAGQKGGLTALGAGR